MLEINQKIEEQKKQVQSSKEKLNQSGRDFNRKISNDVSSSMGKTSVNSTV